MAARSAGFSGQATLPAIEEQFYLIWPAIVLLPPRRALPVAMIGACVAAMAARWWLADNSFAAVLATPARLDALAWGGVLACMGPMRGSGTIGAALIALCYFMPPLDTVLSETGCVLLSGAVVMAVVRRPPWTRWLEHRSLVYIGTISYGMYVWHMVIPQIMHALEYRGITLWIRVPDVYGPARFVILAPLTIGVAAISWHLFERPINDLKRYAPYRRLAVQRVEDEPLMFEGAPPRFDYGVREPQLCESQEPSQNSHGDQVVDVGVHVHDARVRQDDRSRL